MHYQIGSSSSHKSWAAHNMQPGPNSLALYGPPSAQTLNAPHIHTVALPHPNSTPRQYPMSYQHSSTPHSSMIVLHPLLSYGPNLRFNVTRDIAEVQLRPGCSPAMLREPAIQPQVSHMIITIPGVSTTEVMNPRGVTVNDVLIKIREMLYQSVSSHEMHRSSHAGSVKGIDLLGPKVFFAGLTRARDGSDRWEIHFSQSV
ncbi:hypothetical protein AZE42_01296 [Rhizopogon vesiculosus]|uniref:DUF6699 domain-containing protein n=1 Tax=Rhizopogon vesiculosus TaxID=180088 RepID=A0A1J8PHQ1_9AGAM|nr:hypothetical protein AZE42_01296 [Rhizopogon vesiculosus]